MNKGKATGLIVILVVILGIVLYIGGSWQGRKQEAAEKERCRQQLRSCDTRLTVAENQVRLLKARTALYQTAIDLDQRNFGLANAHLREADEPLAKLDAASLGINKSLLDALSKEIADTDIQVAIDLSVQRAKIIQFGYRLDSLISKPAVPPVMPQLTAPSSLPTAPLKPATQANTTK
ncbi:MAG: hypothetical protein A4E66_02691 [Syntrophus sp. PtaB.Bin001]|nr:MAG: hypothetical protein A4E66_02691 [Syntrophus sp. PtaB.Bin001]